MSAEDAAAIAYSVGFYQALGAGESEDRAHRYGVAQVRMQHPGKHHLPVLAPEAR